MCTGGGQTAPSWTRYIYDPGGAIANQIAPKSGVAKGWNTFHAYAIDPAGVTGAVSGKDLYGGETTAKYQRNWDMFNMGEKSRQENAEWNAEQERYNEQMKQYDQQMAATNMEMARQAEDPRNKRRKILEDAKGNIGAMNTVLGG